jgi:hypothetical protein
VQQAQHGIEAAFATAHGAQEMAFIEHKQPDFLNRIGRVT